MKKEDKSEPALHILCGGKYEIMSEEDAHGGFGIVKVETSLIYLLCPLS